MQAHVFFILYVIIFFNMTFSHLTNSHIFLALTFLIDFCQGLLQLESYSLLIYTFLWYECTHDAVIHAISLTHMRLVHVLLEWFSKSGQSANFYSMLILFNGLSGNTKVFTLTCWQLICLKLAATQMIASRCVASLFSRFD